VGVDARFTRDDLDELSDKAYEAAEPADVAARLAAIADTGRLVDPADEGYAFLLAAEVYERADALAEALAMAERALATYQTSGGRAPGSARAFRAELLLRLGRDDDALAELAALRPQMATDAFAATFVPEPDDFADLERASRVGHGDPEAVLLFWPELEYERVDERWPEVLEATGADDWEDYRRRQQAVIVGWAQRHRASLWQVTGSAAGFAEFLAAEGLDEASADLVSLAERYGGYLVEEGEPLPLPPDREDPCWCGSGREYQACCLRLAPR
jgi:tetratricopeptide (TPR) repeat protein